jgi:hypothetical protein
MGPKASPFRRDLTRRCSALNLFAAPLKSPAVSSLVADAAKALQIFSLVVLLIRDKSRDFTFRVRDFRKDNNVKEFEPQTFDCQKTIAAPHAF